MYGNAFQPAPWTGVIAGLIVSKEIIMKDHGPSLFELVNPCSLTKIISGSF